MSIFYRVIIVLLVVAASYSLFGIGHFKWMYHTINTPKAEFQVSGNLDSKITLVEFLNYNCGHCRTLSPAIKELLEIRKDIRYVARPVAFVVEGQTNEGNDAKDELIPLAQNVTQIAMAAGLQGKFWEMHYAFLEYPEAQLPDNFIQETAEIYGLDYDRLIKDSESKEVQKIMENNFSAFNYTGLLSVPSLIINNKIYTITDDNLPNLKQLLDIISQAEQS